MSFGRGRGIAMNFVHLCAGLGHSSLGSGGTKAPRPASTSPVTDRLSWLTVICVVRVIPRPPGFALWSCSVDSELTGSIGIPSSSSL